MLPAVTKLILPVVHVVSCFSNDFLACGGRSVTMCFRRNLLRRGYGGQEERKGRKGVGAGLVCLADLALLILIDPKLTLTDSN